MLELFLSSEPKSCMVGPEEVVSPAVSARSDMISYDMIWYAVTWNDTV